MAVVAPPPSNRFITSNITNALLGAVTGGFAIAQCLTYLALTKNELKYKILIFSLISLSLIVTIGYMVDCITKFGLNYGDYAAQRVTNGPLFVALTSHGIIMLLVLGFYSWRSYIMMGKKLWVLILLTPFVIAAGAVEIWLAAYQLATGNLSIVRANLGNKIALTSAMPAVADIAVTGMMFYALWRTKKLGVSSMSSKVVRRLVKICLETNLITTFFQLLTMVFYLTTGELHFFLVASLPQIYIAALMLWLVSRLGTRQIIAESSGGGISDLPSGFTAGKKSSNNTAFQPSGIQVSHIRSLHVDGEADSELELDEMDRKDRAIRFEPSQAV